jgi:hypothetical protein
MGHGLFHVQYPFKIIFYPLIKGHSPFRPGYHITGWQPSRQRSGGTARATPTQHGVNQRENAYEVQPLGLEWV